jgi:alpha-tubulin suppressor-like RCC1 family protein
VWGWGANAHGQLGLGQCTAWVAAPTEVTAAMDGAWKVRIGSSEFDVSLALHFVHFLALQHG